jgi:hypothetical protein
VAPRRKWKLKLSPCLIKHQAMNMYGKVEVQLHAYLTSALDGGEWVASRYDGFNRGERVPGTHWIGSWVGHRTDLHVVNIKITLRAENLVPVVQPVVSDFIDWDSPRTIDFLTKRNISALSRTRSRSSILQPFTLLTELYRLVNWRITLNCINVQL